MNEKEVKKLLKSHRSAVQKIISLELERKQLRTSVQYNSGIYEGVYSATKKNGTETKLIALAKEEERIDSEIKELKVKKDHVREFIRLLCDDDLEAVLINRYITYHTVEQTAEIMNYHVNTIKAKEKTAIRKLCTKMYQNVF